MTENREYGLWFGRAQGRAAYGWQNRLGADSTPRHRLIRVPTGFGKTLGVASTWLFHRVVRGDQSWPVRLVWTLPMRTLVEQTERECRELLGAQGLLWDGTGSHTGRVGVHVLMGGADAGSFHLHPEQPAILIGTQDMLLSRALNRGYGAPRGRWPMDFGLLSQDALWVLDEVQLMGVGFATVLQLTVFRQDHPAVRPSYTWVMSATLQPAWVEKSPDTRGLARTLAWTEPPQEDRALPLWSTSRKEIKVLPPAEFSEVAEVLMARHRALAGPSKFTLAICNTVARATDLFDRISRVAEEDEVLLVHSRFRGAERESWNERLLNEPEEGASRIVVATQVVEAGLDLSADLLLTELAPWTSLVQRLGRLARRGGPGQALVLDLDTAQRKNAAPYEAEELDAARLALGSLAEGSPRGLAEWEAANPSLLPSLYPYDPPHLVLREEVEELFDTSSDLSGGDIDVSRFIREGDERDLQVAWVALQRDAAGRRIPPPASWRPGRGALCAVPFLAARDWLCGKKSGDSVPRRFRTGVSAFLWDYLEGRWRTPERGELRPGVQVLVDAEVGGYDPTRGFDPASRAPVQPVGMLQADPQELADGAQDHEDLSFAAWQTIAYHGAAVAREVDQLTRLLEGAPDGERWARLLNLAARWHDLGKCHPAFQGAIVGQDRPPRRDLAKAPAGAWRRERPIYWSEAPPSARPGFRHELASVLGLFDVLLRWAPAEHPARLGAQAAWIRADPPREQSGNGASPSPLEEEILALSSDDFDLVAYLVCAHHGKLRARLHAGPADQAAALRAGVLPIRGVYPGDRLPAIDLAGKDGVPLALPESELRLDPATLGLSASTGRSWTERVDGLRQKLGPFALAYFETLLRVADVRASMDRTLSDPALETATSAASGSGATEHR